MKLSDFYEKTFGRSVFVKSGEDYIDTRGYFNEIAINKKAFRQN